MGRGFGAMVFVAAFVLVPATAANAKGVKPLPSCTAALDAAEKLGTKSDLYVVNARRCREGISSAEKATTAKAGPYTPTPADFAIDVTTLSQSCFGSAGCNMTYRITVHYVGAQDPDPATTYSVVYEVDGGDSPKINSFKLTGLNISYPAQESISTPPNPTLTAHATNVLKG